MTVAFSILAGFGILSGLLRRRYQTILSRGTFLILGLLIFDTALFKLGGSFFVDSTKYPVFVLLLACESYLIFKLDSDGSIEDGILPNYSIPIATIAFFSALVALAKPETILPILCISLLLQPFWSTREISQQYFNKKLMVNLLVFFLSMTGLTIYGKYLSGFVYIFLFWFSLDLIPLGLDKDSSKDTSLPIVNRVVLYTLFLQKLEFNISAQTLSVVAGGIGFSAVILLSVLKSRVQSWLLYKRSSEAMLLIIFISQNSKLSYEFLIAVLTFSLVSYVPKILHGQSKLGQKDYVVAILTFLFLTGTLVGLPSEIIKQGLQKSVLTGIGYQYLFYLVLFWLINLTFWVTYARKNEEKTSKIDHLQALTLLSVIIISTLISL